MHLWMGSSHADYCRSIDPGRFTSVTAQDGQFAGNIGRRDGAVSVNECLWGSIMSSLSGAGRPDQNHMAFEFVEYWVAAFEETEQPPAALSISGLARCVHILDLRGTPARRSPPLSFHQDFRGRHAGLLYRCDSLTECVSS